MSTTTSLDRLVDGRLIDDEILNVFVVHLQQLLDVNRSHIVFLGTNFADRQLNETRIAVSSEGRFDRHMNRRTISPRTYVG